MGFGPLSLLSIARPSANTEYPAIGLPIYTNQEVVRRRVVSKRLQVP
jgi:hypothetical protein